MKKPTVLKAETYDDMESIAEPFLDNGYKILSVDKAHLIARKRNYGNRYVHILFLVLILFVIEYNSWLIYVTCFLYIIYFTYYIFRKSEILLVTTETNDKEGNPVEFDDINNLSI
ncbi:hypothetical protein MBCUT_12050 [Methanobrevibacter cuticularis]|uniref:Uncharacterized protein n=1 Tax=Methanobrevibacter cuticularis TaxID=47311 RepID=A0A166DRM0_9EURY|nr:hypothetical protein [Methanobrevibacter cuticularis]KZX15880.1 hypothetical protein MBCUT_12050 [Methanobrevibacter cuticularis]